MVINAAILSIFFWAALQVTLAIRLAHSSEDESSADSDVRAVGSLENGYYTEHHRYATMAELKREHLVAFESDPYSGYHIILWVLSPERFYVAAQPHPPFPIPVPASWAREYGDRVYYLDETQRTHRAPYGTAVPLTGFHGRLPEAWDKARY